MRLTLVAILLLLATTVPASAEPAPTLELDLIRSLQLARAHSRRLRDRDDEVAAAGHRHDQAFARLLPRVGVAARYSRVSHVEPGSLNMPSPVPGVPAPAPVQLGEAVDNQYGLRVTVDQPLFSGGSLRAGLDAAGHAQEASRQRKRQEAMDLEVQVEEAYLACIQARQMLEVTAQSVSLLEALLADASRRLDAGSGVAVDVARIKARLATAGVAQIQARHGDELAHLALATLLGQDPAARFSLAELPVSSEPVASPAQLAAQAREQRPELAVARAQAAAQGARARAEAGGLWPQVWLRAGISYDRPNARYFPPHDQFDPSWDASAMLSWTPWDWGATRHGARAASLDAAVAARTVEELDEAVGLEVARRRLDVATGTARMHATDVAVDAAELAVRRARELCQAGHTSCTLVLDAERDLTQARADGVQSRADARLSRARLRRATGG